MKYLILVALPNRDTTQLEFDCKTKFNLGYCVGGFFTFDLKTGETVHLNMNSVIQITEEE